MNPNGYTAMPNWVLTNPRMTPTTIRVYLALASHADEHGICWPSYEALAKVADCSAATVKRALTVLRGERITKWERTGSSNRYTVAVRDMGPVSVDPSDRSPVRHRDGSPVTHKLDPMNKTQELPAADADEGFLISEDDAPTQTDTVERIPTGADLVAAWVDGYTETQGGPPDPALTKRIAGESRNIVRSRTDRESWRAAWRAFRAAGRDGRYGVLPYLTGHPATAQKPWQRQDKPTVYLTADEIEQRERAATR